MADDAGGSLAREELFAGWRLFFERLAEIDPVVLLVEDAQYADAGLLDFVDHLVEWARNSTIYVLVFTRPELDQLRPALVLAVIVRRSHSILWTSRRWTP